MRTGQSPWAQHPRRQQLTHHVYTRDQNTPGYTCPRCHQPIDWDLRFPHPLSRSADHTIEIQDGGPIDDPNLMTTVHLTCNSSKGATRRHQREREARASTNISVDLTNL